MGRLKPGWHAGWRSLLSAALAGSVMAAAWPAPALAQSGVRAVSARMPELRAVNAVFGGAITGVVSDDRGGFKIRCCVDRREPPFQCMEANLINKPLP